MSVLARDAMGSGHHSRKESAFVVGKEVESKTQCDRGGYFRTQQWHNTKSISKRRFWTSIMPIVYTAIQRFYPLCADRWDGYIKWADLTQLREVISLDGILCPLFFDELTDEDWNHNVQEDFKTFYFVDLDYVVTKVGGNDRVNIVALCQEPTSDELVDFVDPRFAFRGFDLVDHQGGISALVNCGGFPKAFSPTDLSDCGLLTDHKMALKVQKLLRDHYPDEHHAYCDIWAIWQMKSGHVIPSSENGPHQL